MQLILKNRENRKVPKLKDILNKFIALRHRQQAEKRLETQLYNNARAFLSAQIKKNTLDIHKYEMVSEKAEVEPQITMNLNTNEKRSDFSYTTEEQLPTVIRSFRG